MIKILMNVALVIVLIMLGFGLYFSIVKCNLFAYKKGILKIVVFLITYIFLAGLLLTN